MRKLLYIILAIAFVSCSKEPVPVFQKADVIMIDPLDVTQYQYIDLSQLGNEAGVSLKNGDGHYSFVVDRFEGGIVVLRVWTTRNIVALIPSKGEGKIKTGTNSFSQHLVGDEIIKFKVHYE